LEIGRSNRGMEREKIKKRTKENQGNDAASRKPWQGGESDSEEEGGGGGKQLRNLLSGGWGAVLLEGQQAHKKKWGGPRGVIGVGGGEGTYYWAPFRPGGELILGKRRSGAAWGGEKKRPEGAGNCV